VSNAFDVANYSSGEPATVIAGDRIAWKRSDLDVDYPVASYSLTYSARLEGSGTTEIALTATESGTDYIVEVPAATSAAWTVGRYHWQAYIIRTSDSERVTVDSGVWEVRANRDAATTDPRTHARITLEAIEAVIEGRATKDQLSYSIAGRSLSLTPVADLLLLRSTYQAEVKQQEQLEQYNRVGIDPRRMGIRFRRV